MIYSMKCGTCNGESIGETARPLSVRMKERKDSVKKKNLKSALGKHVVDNREHHIDFDHVKVIQVKHHIKNSKHLVEMLTEFVIEEDEVLKSCDVSALFTSVPFK